MVSRLTIRTLLRIDAVLSGATGALMLGDGWLLDDLLGLNANLLWVAGAACIVYAMGLVGISLENSINTAQVEVAVGLNLVWAVGCLAIAFSDWMEVNTLGVGFLLLQVLGAMILAMLYVLALRASASGGGARVSPR